MTKAIATNQITADQLARVMPNKLKAKITPELVNDLNGLMNDQHLRENFRDNLLSYTGVMKDGKYKIQSYIDAVRYVSHKLLGSSNLEAYTKTFPDRFQRLINEGADNKTISSYVAAYNKNQLVNKIVEQTIVPVHVLNADVYQKAINTQAALMISANSEKVRSDAANSLLTHLKPPEVTKVEVDIGIKQDSAIDELRQTTLALAEQQRKMISEKVVNTVDVAHSKIINAEVVED